ncbi:hypothetical protein SACS_0353 [Parasaccharibacter apium]|uniref:Uncharacterized protein n=1 Tax=Parasaccharibacter apium TaxID=1510841 RepID=A0A7U7J0H6_9PROT|nr:hypothetical protein SACS_0353 [Parasaccharibacter apium]
MLIRQRGRTSHFSLQKSSGKSGEWGKNPGQETAGQVSGPWWRASGAA